MTWTSYLIFLILSFFVTDVGAIVAELLEVDVSSLVGLVEGAVDEEDGISLVG